MTLFPNMILSPQSQVCFILSWIPPFPELILVHLRAGKLETQPLGLLRSCNLIWWSLSSVREGRRRGTGKIGPMFKHSMDCCIYTRIASFLGMVRPWTPLSKPDMKDIIKIVSAFGHHHNHYPSLGKPSFKETRIVWKTFTKWWPPPPTPVLYLWNPYSDVFRPFLRVIFF